MVYNIIVRRAYTLKCATKYIPIDLCLFTRPYSIASDQNIKQNVRQIGRATNQLKLTQKSQECIASLLEQYPPVNIDNSEILLTAVDSVNGDVFHTGTSEPCTNERFIPIALAKENPFNTIREKLPIFANRQEILNLINENQVIVLSGATGSGKTTQVPQYIMEDCAEKLKPCRIICTQPRRLATISIAERVSNERNDRLGQSVGYQIRLDSCVSPNTNLTFTTSGFLLRRIIGEKSSELLNNLTHLIFDEVHEREDITDFLLIVIKDALKMHPHLKVILMSATLDADIFCKYFFDCPRIDIPGSMFPVEMIYLKEILNMTAYKTLAMERFQQISIGKERLIGANIGNAIESGNFEQRLVNRAKYNNQGDNRIDTNVDSIPNRSKTDRLNLLHKAYRSTSNTDEIDHDLLFTLIKHIHTTKPTDGSILVFLPGLRDITEQENRITRSIFTQDYQLYLLHSSLNGTNRNDQERIFQTLPKGIRKIILSTNIAETSLTISDVAYVVDAGKSKQNKFDYRSQTAFLQSNWISKACAKQRAGRAGRTQNGICYRLYSDEDYEAMDAYTQPEILRVPLTDICLNSKILLQKGSIEEFLLKAIQPPPAESIRSSIALLKCIDALDANECITNLGIHLAKLPVDAQVGKCILYAILLKCFDPVVTIISMLSANNPFELTNGYHAKAIKRSLADSTVSDHMVKLNAYVQWREALSKNLDAEYSFEHYLINDNMTMVHGVRSIICNHLKRLGLLHDERDLNENAAKWPVIKACLTAGFYPNVCRIEKRAEKFSSKYGNMLAFKSSIVGKSTGKISAELLHSHFNWVVYGSKQQSSYVHSAFLIDDITPLTTINIALFGGSINKKRPVEIYSPNADKLYMYSVDGWIYFVCSEYDAHLLFNLRHKFNEIFVNMLKTPNKFTTSVHEDKVIGTVVNVLENEESVCVNLFV